MAAASSGEILMRTVSAVELTAGCAGLAAAAARRANSPEHDVRDGRRRFDHLRADRLRLHGDGAEKQRVERIHLTFTRQYPARCGVSRNAMRFE
jgi:hypothetical protein